MNLEELELIRGSLPDGTAALDLVERRIALLARTEAQPKKDWDRFCTMFHLTPADFGRKFKIRNTVYEVIGISPSRPKFAIDVKRSYDGKQFRVPATAVK